MTVRVRSVRDKFGCPRITAIRRASTTSSREDQTFILPDGRILGYAEYGCQSGYPLMFFHGFPSSRLEGHPADQIARRNRIRIIVPDRPGFGLSSLQRKRRITDWPNDVKALAQHLRLSRFAILGGSGGGPYALACAYALPHEMMSAVGILAGAPPWQAGTQDVPISSRVASFAANNWAAGFTKLTNLLLWTIRKGLDSRSVIRRIDTWLNKTNGETDGSTTEERRKRFLRLILEGFAQGSSAFIEEAKLLTQDWGFRFEDVGYDRIQLWHGTEDKNAPIRMVRYMVERLPHGVLHEFKGESHWTLFRQLENILSNLVPSDRSLYCSLKA